MSDHPLGDDMVLQDKNARERTILNSDTMQELGEEDERILFDRLLPDLISDNGPEGEDAVSLEFGCSNTDNSMRESMLLQRNFQLTS